MRESVPRKIWNVIYPVICHFVIYFAVIYGGILIFNLAPSGNVSLDSFMNNNFALITIVALIISAIVALFFYRNDRVVYSDFLKRKPINIVWIMLVGALFSHGLNILMSLINIDGIIGSYQEVQQEIFGANAILVIIRAVIITPIAEELIFRGLCFNRIKKYTNFWVAALVSSALFGAYHMNLAQGIYAFIFAIAICMVYERYQNLFAAMLMHFTANLLSVILQYTNASYPTTWLFVTVMIITIILATIIYWFIIKKNTENKNNFT